MRRPVRSRRPESSSAADAARALAAVATALLIAAAGGCELPAETWDPQAIEAVPVHQRGALIPPAGAAPATLKVMAWNIKYGAARIDFWFDLWGDRVQMTRLEVEGNLANIVRLVNEVAPDVLMTEEIEIKSRRSAYVNMVTAILEGTALNYAACFPTWRSKYIPWWSYDQHEIDPITFAARRSNDIFPTADFIWTD